MAHAYCMQATESYKHTLKICNNYSFSSPKIVSRTDLNVTFQVHCLPCFSPLISIAVHYTSVSHIVVFSNTDLPRVLFSRDKQLLLQMVLMTFLSPYSKWMDRNLITPQLASFLKPSNISFSNHPDNGNTLSTNFMVITPAPSRENEN